MASTTNKIKTSSIIIPEISGSRLLAIYSASVGSLVEVYIYSVVLSKKAANIKTIIYRLCMFLVALAKCSNSGFIVPFK
ncbi:hypothetical protein D3C84_987620 [compost metagenome]